MIGQRNYVGSGFTTIETRSSKTALAVRGIDRSRGRHGAHSIFQGKSRCVRVALSFDKVQKKSSIITVSCKYGYDCKEKEPYCTLQFRRCNIIMREGPSQLCMQLI